MQRDAKIYLHCYISGKKKKKKRLTEQSVPFDANLVFAPRCTIAGYRFRTTVQRPSFCITSLVGLDQTSKSFVQTLNKCIRLLESAGIRQRDPSLSLPPEADV